MKMQNDDRGSRMLEAAARHPLSRRGLLRIGAASIGGTLGSTVHRADAAVTADIRSAMDQVVPPGGVTLGFSFGGSLQRLIAAGALDPAKYEALYRPAGGVPVWVMRLLRAPSYGPIHLSRETAGYLLNLLWPLGLATRTRINLLSPINDVRLPSYASTAGWTLGEGKGYTYFNRVHTMTLSSEQEALVHDVATTTFRPCCDNPTFFQDCNHGSALLGLIELVASQRATREQLYGAALTANSYWFPENYVLTSVQFMRSGHSQWRSLAPSMILGTDFSSLSGWQRNVSAPLTAARFTLPSDLSRQLGCGL